MKRFKSSTACFLIYGIVISILLVFVTSYVGTKYATASNSEIKIYLNNTPLVFGEYQNDPEPYIKDGRTLVPFRKIFEALGMEIEWNGNTRTVNAQNNTTEMQLLIGQNYAFVNNFKKQLDVAPEITDGRTFVPLRFVSESYGAEVIWEAATRSIYINYAQGEYQLGQEASYKDTKFSIDTIKENLEESHILVTGKTNTKIVPLIIELKNSTKRSYSREIEVTGIPTLETGKYEYSVKIFVKKDFKTEYVSVKTYSEGIQPFKIAEYAY